jgi:hypothetical protein
MFNSILNRILVHVSLGRPEQDEDTLMDRIIADQATLGSHWEKDSRQISRPFACLAGGYLLLAGAALTFPHTYRFGATGAGRRQPQRAERRPKHCEADTDQKGYLGTADRIARQEQRH